MNITERALELLTRTRRSPKMWDTTRESLLNRVTAIIGMSFEDKDLDGYFDVEFFKKHAGIVGNTYATLLKRLDADSNNDWSYAVIDDAIKIITEKKDK